MSGKQDKLRERRHQMTDAQYVRSCRESFRKNYYDYMYSCTKKNIRIKLAKQLHRHPYQNEWE
jgi:hypothetical protein